jgi:nucleoside-diphosphate-sugar epimerase
MRVFVTGATGFIGSAVVQELLEHGHQVLGLARNDEGEQKLRAAGVEVHRGDLKDLESLRAGARACDGVAHLGYVHDFSSFQQFLNNAEVDRQAAEAMVEAMEGTNKPFVLTSGVGILGGKPRASEEDAAADPNGPRAASEQVALTASERGVRGMVVRFPPTVHGAHDHGFLPIVMGASRGAGRVGYVGEGTNPWSAVPRSDAASLFRLALERGEAGTRLHAVAEEGVPFRTIAQVLADGMGLDAVSLTPEEAGGQYGMLAHFVGMDISATSARTRAALGWEPKGPALLDDLRAHYFG